MRQEGRLKTTRRLLRLNLDKMSNIFGPPFTVVTCARCNVAEFPSGSDELELDGRGCAVAVKHDLSQRVPGGIAERVLRQPLQSVVVPRMSQAILEEHEYGQRHEQHGDERRTVRHVADGRGGGGGALCHSSDNRTR